MRLLSTFGLRSIQLWLVVIAILSAGSWLLRAIWFDRLIAQPDQLVQSSSRRYHSIDTEDLSINHTYPRYVQPLKQAIIHSILQSVNQSMRFDSLGQPMTYHQSINPLFCRYQPQICSDFLTQHVRYETRMMVPFVNPQESCSKVIRLFLEPAITRWWPWIEDLDLQSCETPRPCTFTEHEVDAELSISMRDLSHPASAHTKRAVLLTESFHRIDGSDGPDFDPAVITDADLLISYDRRSDVPINYWYGLVGDDEDLCDDESRCFSDPLPSFEQLNATAAYSAIFISNCIGGRVEYIQELMRYIPIDSFGSCLHTPGLPQGNTVDKADTSKKYLFTIAFENWPLQDYVTEKLYAALAWGNVPVYWGSPNVQDLLPAGNSVINAFDYASPKQLAAYLMELRDNPAQYEKYRDWRRSLTVTTSWKAGKKLNLNSRQDSWVCRACRTYQSKFCRSDKSETG